MNRLLINSYILTAASIAIVALFIGSADRVSRDYANLESRLRVVDQANLNLDAAVLALRLGIQHNYDQLTCHETEFASSLNSDLDRALTAWQQDPAVIQLVENLHELGATKLLQTSDFKANHAIVKNSVAALSRLAEDLRESNQPQQKSLLTALESTGLKFYMSGNESDEKAFRQAINSAVDNQELFKEPNKMQAGLLVRHCYKLIELRNEMQANVRTLVQTPMRESTSLLKDRVSAIYKEQLAHQAKYRYGLIAAISLLFTYCVTQAIWLYKYATALRNSNEALERRVEERTAALRHSKEFFQSVLDSIHSQVAVLNRQGTIVDTNSSWKRTASQRTPKASEPNYLTHCRATEQNRGLANGKILAEEIEAVLESRKPYSTCELREFQTDECRTFQVNITKLPESTDGQVVVTKSDITARIIAEKEREQLHKELQDAARQAGMAEVAVGVLHNVGNVLNSVNVSSNVLRDRIGSSPVRQLARASDVIQEQSDQLSEFFASDPRGKHFPSLLSQLSFKLQQENNFLSDEVMEIAKNVDHIKEIVSMHQSFVKKSGVTENASPLDLIEDALRINEASLERHKIEIIRDYNDGIPVIPLARHEVLQILINLIKNGKQATEGEANACLRLSVRKEPDFVSIEVKDNGVGIPEQNLQKIFSYGFTTKKHGNGFGLHSCANTAREFGGSLSVHSEGAGKGATFKLRLPMKPEVRLEAAPSAT